MHQRILVIPSVHEQLDHVLEFVEAFTSDNGLSDDLSDTLMLLSTEAVTNAMEHGNGYDPTKHVTLVLRLNEEAVEMCVEDEGGGFHPEATPNPLAEENLLMDGGRGIFLMEELSDEVHYENDGRCVRMVFNLA